MPLDPSIAEMLEKHYGDYPGPDAELFEVAEKISNYLSQSGVSTQGVIAVARSNFPYHYLNFSPALQSAVKQNIGGRLYVLGRELEDITGRKFILRVKVEGGGDVDRDIIKQTGEVNPGCAEKKIITALMRYGEKMTAFAVLAHPNGYFNETTSAHVVLASTSRTYIAPCKSCLLAGRIHKSTLGKND